jgi:hypothetical protein
VDEEKKKAIRALLAKRERERTVTEDMARRWLMEEGLLNDRGKLRPQFGGEGPDEPKD